MKKSNHHIKLRINVPILLLLAAFMSASILSTGADTSVDSVPQNRDDERLEKARGHYMEAEYDAALNVLKELSGDESISQETRRETFRLLGMVYTIMNDKKQALDAVKDWIALEPPLVEADPDRDLLDFVHMYYEARKEVNQQRYCQEGTQLPAPCQYGIEQQDPGIKTLAIIDFDNNSIDDHDRLDPLGGGLADLMIRQLNGVIDLKIVERERLNWLMNEIDLSQSGRVSTETAVRIGQLIGAHSVLLGDYMYFDKKLTIGVRVVKVETSEILLSASEQGKLEDFTEIAGKLSEHLAETIGVDFARQDWEENTPTNSLEALMAYADGMSLYDRGDYKAAYDKFMEALEYDPNYEKARLKTEAIYPAVAKAGN